MPAFNLETQYLYKLISMPRGATSTIPIGNKCNAPFHEISVDYLGNCLMCSCDGWLPLPVGQVQDFTSIDEVFSCDLAKVLQDDVSNGNFQWCAVDHCGIRKHDIIKNHLSLTINIDESCNLQCPTCRSFFMNFTNGKIYENKLIWANHIVKLLDGFDKPTTIAISGNGDPFASLIYRPLLMSTKSNDKHRYRIMTNGLLLKKLLTKTSVYSNITEYSISIDAGDAETYEKVRLRGKWNNLLENLNFLKEELKDKNKIVNLNFCLHKENLSSLLNFVELVEKYQWQGNIQSIEDWRTIKNFDYQNVLNNNNELFGAAIKTLKLISKNKRIFLSGKIQELIKNN